jgi:hypothetical protein
VAILVNGPENPIKKICLEEFYKTWSEEVEDAYHS